MIRDGALSPDLRQSVDVRDLPSLEYEAAVLLIDPYPRRAINRTIGIPADET
jgi:hypothetical protein